ncbi:unnamed protein product [Effrenium voratum]|nr:unnamed protein product [Effrenium voratum]
MASKVDLQNLLSLPPWPRLKVWGPALVIFSCLAAGAVTPWKAWFWYHPAAMLIGYVALMGNAVLVKKIGGLQATQIHGHLMNAGTLVCAFGYYVIYSNKEANGKPHNTSWHGKLGSRLRTTTPPISWPGFARPRCTGSDALSPWTPGLPRIGASHIFQGLVVMVFTVIMAVAGKIALDPSMGMLRTAKEVRKMHRYSGRIMLVAAWVCSIMGWYTFQKMAILPVAIFALPLLAFVKVMM